MHDARFRRKILVSAQQMAQELDDIEDQLEQFRELDLPAFEAWRQKFFAAEIVRRAELEKAYVEAVELHNSVIRLARLKHLSLARAYEYHGAHDPSAEADDEPESDAAESNGDDAEIASPDQAQLPEFDAAAADKLKSIYRKFVLRLHPDRLTDDTEASERRWQKRLWNLALAAREGRDVLRLEQLYGVALVRLMDFGELTLNGAHDVYAWLRSELLDLRQARNEAAENPAWGFSRRQDLRSLRKKIARRFKDDLEFLESQLIDIREQRAQLEELALKPRRRRRPNASASQLSFFD